MSDYQNKVDGLQQEIEMLEQREILPPSEASCKPVNKRAVIMFLCAIVLPFLLYAFIYTTGFGWVMTDGYRDRKKALKWTILITVVLWVVMAMCYYFFRRQ